MSYKIAAKESSMSVVRGTFDTMENVNKVTKKEKEQTLVLNKLDREQSRIRRLGPELRGKLFVIKTKRRTDKASLVSG